MSALLLPLSSPLSKFGAGRLAWEAGVGPGAAPLAGWGEWGRRQKNRIGRDRERALSLRRLCLSRADLFFFPPPFFPPLSPAHIVFSFGLRWGLSLHWMAVFSVPSPLLPSLTPASCLFVFLSSCLLLSLYPSAPGSVVSYLPPHIFRARRRDGLLGRRREAMPEEHAAERSWADGYFCRVARPLSASSFFRAALMPFH